MAEEIKQYKYLGVKTLFIFIVKRTGILFILALLLVAVFAARIFIPFQYLEYVNFAILICLGLFIMVALFIFSLGLLEYLRYSIFIDGQSIKINRGIIREVQVGFPFRRINSAIIERGIVDQLLGISNLVLIIVAEDNKKTAHDESRCVLPALDKKIAIEMQDIILKEAEIEEVDMKN